MSELPTAVFGRTGVEVTKLGYGAMEVRGVESRGPRIDEDAACRLLNGVLDAGITFIDTSPDYGRSEELIGKALSGRRTEFFLASKCACPVIEAAHGEHNFTRENVRAGVEQSLRRMKTDRLDLVQFHASPSRQTLEQHDSVAELQALQQEGKVRFIGMSGELPNLPDQIAMGVFDAFQIPYSALQREHEELIATAAEAGGGTIIRGGVARGVPGPDEVARQFSLDAVSEEQRSQLQPILDTFAQRRARWEQVQVELGALLEGMSMMEFMLRFTLSHPHLHTTIVGTANPDHLADNLAAATKGPLPDDLYREAKRVLAQPGGG
jgi:aryl-alcohol dehydrogenase-like predicted oxidoreductase